MSDQTHDVDWAEVERRAGRRNLLGMAFVPIILGAIVLLTGRFAFWEGADAWWAVGGFLVYGLAVQGATRATTRLRARTGQGFRIQYALRHHVDPGPGLRERADRHARWMAGNGWFAWLIPVTPASFLLAGRWDRPLLAVPATLVLAAAALAVVLSWSRQTAAARRWVEDPPGPAREVRPPNAWERWFTGRRFMWLLVGFVVVNAVVIAGLILVLD